MAGLSKSAKYYKSHPGARRVKAKYDTAYHAKPERIKYRTRLNRERRRRHLRGSDKDLSHTKDNRLVLEDRSTNRGRQGSDGNSTKK